jgi:ribonucleotide monophosphatase NagD (HAD superfamily)
MRELAQKYMTVLVVGGEGEKCREVAEGYGFKEVITPGDIIKANSAVTPFRQLTARELENSRLRDYDNLNRRSANHPGCLYEQEWSVGDAIRNL